MHENNGMDCTRQVLARWVDKDKASAWKMSIIAQVANGNSPGGKSTRFGILVMTSIFLKRVVADAQVGSIP